MSDVAEIIRDALRHLGTLDATETPEAWQVEDGMRALNLMMTRWEANGLALGWVNVTNPDAPLPAPAEAEEAIGFNLALKLAPSYEIDPRATVIEFARVGLAALRADIASRDAARTEYDLPSGNAQRGRGDFYGGGY